MIGQKLTTVTLDYPLFRGKALRLARTPKYLRFVCSNLTSKWRESLDALDQLDDEPGEEYILAAVIDPAPSLHRARLVGVNLNPLRDHER